jgi:hypothetical protein
MYCVVKGDHVETCNHRECHTADTKLMELLMTTLEGIALDPRAHVANKYPGVDPISSTIRVMQVTKK